MADMREPAFPVPVVRLIVTDGEGRVLLLQRADSRYASGSWCLPGGKIDYGDTAEGTAAKELKEETSLVLESCNFLFYQDSLPTRDGGMHCVNLYFECEASGTVSLNEESGRYAWIGPQELNTYDIVFRNDLGLLRYWSEQNR